MVVMFRMSQEKRDKMTKKIEKMMDFLDEFRMCLEEGEESPEYRGSYRKDWDEEEESPRRYRYRSMGGR